MRFMNLPEEYAKDGEFVDRAQGHPQGFAQTLVGLQGRPCHGSRSPRQGAALPRAEVPQKKGRGRSAASVIDRRKRSQGGFLWQKTQGFSAIKTYLAILRIGPQVLSPHYRLGLAICTPLPRLGEAVIGPSDPPARCQTRACGPITFDMRRGSFFRPRLHFFVFGGRRSILCWIS